MAPTLIIFGAVSLIAGIIFLVWKYEKKRTEMLTAVCGSMGFTWFGELDDAPPMPLFERGHGKSAKNAMRGELAGHACTIFDYKYTVGGGKNSHTYQQTVVLFPQGVAGLPDFELAPENVFHKFGQVFGYQDIDFEHNEEFSKLYLLRGENEAAIRAGFTATVLAYLAGQPGWSVQTRGGAALLFRSGKRSKPEELPAFVAETLQILSGLGAKA